MAKKGPQGNKEQLLIALELSHKLSTKEVAEKLGKPLITVQKLKQQIDKGWKPDLSEAAIAAAPPSPGMMVPAAAKKDTEHGGDSSEKPGGNGTENGGKKPFEPIPGVVSLAAIQIKSQYTPIMYMARLAAEDKWGWPGNMPYEDFMDICLYHFFKDRGITLQGYIIDEEVNGPGASEIKELTDKVKELMDVVKGGKVEAAS